MNFKNIIGKLLPSQSQAMNASKKSIVSRNTMSDGLSEKLTTNGVQFYGFTDVLPNPDPILKNMGWGKDVEAYRELLSDPQLYGAIENNRKPGVKSLNMYLDNEHTDKAELEFFQNYFNFLKSETIYHNIVSHTLDTPQFGRMVFGLVWDYQDGYFVPVKISPMPHEMCRFNVDGELLVANAHGMFEPPANPARYITLRHKPTVANPYGEAILAKCYWNIRFKKEGLKMWALFTEKFGMPWVSASYNPQALANSYGTNDTDAAVAILLDGLASMARDGVIVFPDNTSVNLLDGGKTSSVDIYERLVRICDEQNTKLQLGHSGATESTSGDKLSNDTTATDVRSHIIESDKMFPIMFWNKVISLIHQFNFSSGEAPVFDLYSDEDVDMVLAERDAALVPVLMQSGQKFSKSYLLKSYGFDDTDLEQTDIMQPAQAKTQAATKAERMSIFQANLGELYQNAKAPDFPDQDLIDDEVPDVINEGKVNSILADAIGTINDAEGFDDLKKNIGKILKDMKTDNFEDSMTNILFVADVIGRLSADGEVKELK